MKTLLSLVVMSLLPLSASAQTLKGAVLEARCKFRRLGTETFMINLATRTIAVKDSGRGTGLSAADGNWVMMGSFTKEGQRKLPSVTDFEIGPGAREGVTTVLA